MKKITPLIIKILGICLFSFFIACSNEEIDDKTDEIIEKEEEINQDEYISCTINGTPFLSKDDARFIYVNVIEAYGNVTYQFVGINSETNSVGFLFVNKYDGLGTYSPENNTTGSNVNLGYTISGVKSYSTDGGPSAPANTTEGSITITLSTDEYIEGTFAFKAVAPDWTDTQNPVFTDVVTVTDGKFRIKR